MDKHQQKAYDEVTERLAFYDKVYPLLKDLAEWGATTDSWYDLFKGFQKRAKELLK